MWQKPPDQSITEWIRAEHEKADELIDQLRTKLTVIPGADLSRWIVEVRDQFERFRAHFTKHMALEEKVGFTGSLTEIRPTLAERIERILHEHTEFTYLLDVIRTMLKKIGPEDRLLIRDCCHRILDLISYVEHHETEENDLVEFVFTDDIGTND